jgi:hypothetical protein
MEMMPPEAMGGMGPMHMEMMPPPCMGSMGPMHMEMMPPHCMGGMTADHMGHMPPEAMAGMDAGMMAHMPPGMQVEPGAWGDAPAGFGDMSPMGGDPMGGDPMGGDPMGGAPVGGAPASMGSEFDGAMAAMDTAASANMAEGMETANTAADADEGKVDTEPGGGDVV